MPTRRSNTAVSAGIIAGLLVSSLFAGQHGHAPGYECAGCASGQCQAGTPHGYWKPTWRRWPGASTYRGYRQPAPTVDTPVAEIPDDLDEVRTEPRTRSDAPLESPTGSPVSPGTGGESPSAPNGVIREPFGGTPDSGFSIPDMTIPPPADKAPLDTPPPLDNLFDDLSPPPESNPETIPSDNLFDDFGANLPTHRQASGKIRQRSIKSRGVRSGGAQLAVLEAVSRDETAHNSLVPQSSATVDGTVLEELAPPTPADQPVQLEVPLQPIDEDATAPQSPVLPILVPPNQLSQASHLEEVPIDAAATALDGEPVIEPATPTPGGNPLRAAVHAPSGPAPETAAAKPSSSQPRGGTQLKAVQVSAKPTQVAATESATVKRLKRTTLRNNPLRHQ